MKNMFGSAFSTFMYSFRKLKTDYLYIVLFDALFIILAYYIYTFWSSVIISGFQSASQSIGTLQNYSPLESVAEYALFQGQANIVTSFWRNAILYSIIFAVLVIAAWLLSRALIWSIIMKKGFTWRHLKMFILLNIAWQPINAVVLAIFVLIAALLGIITQIVISYALDAGLTPYIAYPLSLLPALFVTLPVFLFGISITYVLYMHFYIEKRIGISLRKMLDTVILRLSRHYADFVLMAALFIAVSIAANAARLLYGPGYLIAAVALLILYSSWLKFYVVAMLKA